MSTVPSCLPNINIELYGHLSVSNESPEDEDLDAIQALLRQPRGEMEALSAQLLQLQAEMTEIHTRRQRLEAHIRPLRAIASPIRRLPDDILQEIFLWCLPGTHYPTLDPLQAPLLLTQICRRWRYVANDTRRLWTSIHIPIPVLHIPSQSIPLVYAENERYKLKAKFIGIADAFVAVVEAWIGRIGGCGLSFSVFQEDHQSREEDACLQSVLEVLLRRSTQWENVDIATPLRSVGAIVDLQPEDVPTMRSLSAWSTSRHQLTRTGAFPFALGGAGLAPQELLPSWKCSRMFEAPLLESLSLFRIDEPLVVMPINWARLTSLAIEKQGTLAEFGYVDRAIVIDLPVIASVLRQCIHLQRARLALTPCAPEPPSNHGELVEPIQLPSLVSLAFFEDKSSSLNLFKILETPCLRKLEFQTSRKPDPAAGNGVNYTFSLLPFLRRYGPKIEQLTLDTQYILPLDRVKCWETLPGLRKLRLRPSTFESVKYPGDEQGMLPFTNCDLRQFQVPFSAPNVMPKLRSFECTTLSTLSDRGVLELLKDRKRLGLRRAKLSYEKDWDRPVNNFAEEVGSLRVGMDIVLEKKIRPSFVQPRHGLKARRCR
ncbi:hypothetical protein DFP72DRAFT_1133944 [Ephemerocybe angulata]|uniref:F-box domain-containing protein n=1 Tax=Ephemerocybe angulata TaxID=980116 RepID=A0A8H6M4T8_9AGAR|nr:hypothetical protein DFP72DRAFT_1133944 [Tulosesus angulatus]